MNKYYEAIRLVENKFYTLVDWKDVNVSWVYGNQDITRAIETLYELLDLYIKEKGKVIFK